MNTKTMNDEYYVHTIATVGFIKKFTFCLNEIKTKR